MKNQLFALIGLGLLLATASAYAQTGIVKASVPFNFTVDKADLPAGDYTFHALGTTSAAMAIESSDGDVAKMILPNACVSAHAQEKTKLVFRRYGAQYFLAQIWVEGSERGKELPLTKREKEVAMDYPAQSVVVVATLR